MDKWESDRNEELYELWDAYETYDSYNSVDVSEYDDNLLYE